MIVNLSFKSKYFSFNIGNSEPDIDIKVFNDSNNNLPEYKTSGSAGVDLMVSKHVDTIILPPGSTRLIPTDLFCEIPKGYELQVRARSGLSIKAGIGMTNGIGTIDSKEIN